MNLKLRALDQTEEMPAMRLAGIACAYNTLSRDMGFYEKIMPNAFVFPEDLKALAYHDPNMIIGRQSNGTLQIMNDDSALSYEIRLPNTQYARDLFELVKDGYCNGASFGYLPIEEKYEYDDDIKEMVFNVHKAELLEISVTPNPAYLSSSAFTREYIKRNFPDNKPEVKPIAPFQIETAERKLKLVNIMG